MPLQAGCKVVGCSVAVARKANARGIPQRFVLIKEGNLWHRTSFRPIRLPHNSQMSAAPLVVAGNCR